MKQYQTLISSCVIAASLIIAGIELRSGIVRFKAMDRSVMVKGLAEKEVKADKVIWPLVYKELGSDPSEMYEVLERKNNKVIAFLKAGGVRDDEISVNPPVISDRQADNYGNEIMNYRYKATSVITVTSSDVDKIRLLMRRQAELMRQGIALVSEDYGGNAVTYEFTGLNKIKPQMVEEATKKARETAIKFAEDAESTLGGIKSAQQGQFSIENRDATSPYIKRVRVVTTVEYSLE